LLSEYSNVPKDSIFLSSGSDIIIKEFIFLFSENRKMIIADPTFIIISNAARKTTCPLTKIRLKEPEFKLSISPILEEKNKPTLVVLDNPNNPTGAVLLEENELKKILENENVILLIDEAYFEFSNTTFAHLTNNYPNLGVLRTLSKSFGLAGSGIGYLIGGDSIQEKFRGLEIMLPYPSVIAGINALKNTDYMTSYVREVASEKKRILKLISDIGLSAYPSNTNFLLMKTNTRNISQKLAEKGVLVSDLSNYSLEDNLFRVTIGSREENDYFLECIRNIVG
jgi:histidinol-phosphate aminotransferase